MGSGEVPGGGLKCGAYEEEKRAKLVPARRSGGRDEKLLREGLAMPY